MILLSGSKSNILQCDASPGEERREVLGNRRGRRRETAVFICVNGLGVKNQCD